MTDCTKVPTLDDIYQSKDAMDDIQSFTYSTADTFIDSKGVTRNTLTSLKTQGLIVFQTHAELDAYTPTSSVEEKGAFKVDNDPNTSLNGYYAWVSDTTYIKANDLANGVVESGNPDATSGGTVYDHVESETSAIRADESARQTTAQKKEAIAKTNDNVVVVTFNGEEIELVGTKLLVNDGFQAFALKTDDGYALLEVGQNGVVKFCGLTNDFDGISNYNIITEDGYELLGFNDTSGLARITVGGNRMEFSANSVNVVKGEFCTGMTSDIRGRSEWFAYFLNSKFGTGKVIGKTTEDWATPHIMDNDVFQVWEADGQSWQTIGNYNAPDTIYEDSTGATRESLDVISPMVVTLRKFNHVGIDYPEGDYTAQVSTISNGETAGELYRFKPYEKFSIARVSAICYTTQCVRLGANCDPVINLQVGWPGTTSEKFLPEGSSYDYIDDDGVPQTTDAVIHPDAGHYLWEDNLSKRQSVEDTIKLKWRDKKLRYKFLSWIQGPFEDYGNATGFMEEYRIQQDSLMAGRVILWDQRGGESSTLVKGNGIQASIDFCQANLTGNDFLVGPRYPHKLYDYIHHSSMGALEYAERTGQCAAYIEKYKTWEPVWVTDVDIVGDTITITTNTPIQTQGELVVDESIGIAPDLGFTLWDDTLNTQIAINSVVIDSNNKIVIVASQVLSGDVEVGYAVRALTTTPTGTVQNPSISATIGNLKMVGVDAPSILPKNVAVTLDHWLCAYKRIHTI